MHSSPSTPRRKIAVPVPSVQPSGRANPRRGQKEAIIVPPTARDHETVFYPGNDEEPNARPVSHCPGNLLKDGNDIAAVVCQQTISPDLDSICPRQNETIGDMNKRNLIGRSRIWSSARILCETGLRAKRAGRFLTVVSLPQGIPLPLEHAVRAKSAELWLRLGEPLEALSEIESVPHSFRRNAWLHKLHATATREAQNFQLGTL